MKSIINNAPTKQKGFPYLASSGDEIVMFTFTFAGTVVASISTRGYKVGHYSATWDSQRFDDFDGSVTLSND